MKRLGGVLGRLDVVLGHLGSVLQAPERGTMNFQWFSEFFMGGGEGRAWTRYGGAVRSGPLNYHLSRSKQIQIRNYHLTLVLRRRAERGGGYLNVFKYILSKCI